MDFSTAAWFALLGFILPPISTFLLCHGSDAKVNWKIRLGALGLPIGLLCASIMVCQGLHLWNLGWEVPTVDPDTAARISTKARGRGGIIILAIQYLPQFLVFGYGWIIWEITETGYWTRRDFFSPDFWRCIFFAARDGTPFY